MANIKFKQKANKESGNSSAPVKMIPRTQTLKGAPGHKTDRYPITIIFAQIAEEYIKKHADELTEDQITAIRCIAQCKTGKLGYNVYKCTECGLYDFRPRSCRNRNCPSCGGLENEMWVEEIRGYMVDAPCFHVVFTMPDELTELCVYNKRFFYNLMLSCAGKTVVKLGRDPKYLGADPGVIAVLHTFGAQLNYHVHVHMIVEGAGLSKDGKTILKVPSASVGKNPDGTRKKQFFIPLGVLTSVFRGMFLDALIREKEAGKLNLPEKYKNSYEWNELIRNLRQKDWIAFCKETFNGNGDAVKYLGRYINRIAISNSRIVRYDGENVTFVYKDYKDNCRMKTKTVSYEQFVGLVIQHVLPKGLQKVRYFGFLNNRYRTANLKKFKELQGKATYTPRFTRKSDPVDVMETLYGADSIRKCPNCGKPALEFVCVSKGSCSLKWWYEERQRKKEVAERKLLIQDRFREVFPKILAAYEVAYGCSADDDLTTVGQQMHFLFQVYYLCADYVDKTAKAAESANAAKAADNAVA